MCNNNNNNNNNDNDNDDDDDNDNEEDDTADGTMKPDITHRIYHIKFARTFTQMYSRTVARTILNAR